MIAMRPTETEESELDGALEEVQFTLVFELVPDTVMFEVQFEDELVVTCTVACWDELFCKRRRTLEA